MVAAEHALNQENDGGLVPLYDAADRVTGPAPLDVAEPKRQNTRSVAFFRNLKQSDHSEKAFRRDLAQAVSVMSISKRGRQLLETLADNDIQLGGLTPGQSFGYYLAYDRALYTQTADIAQTVRVIAHEGRHAAQTAAGFSTVTEYHEPGTKLPYDTKSYLRLNRVLEADADATALAVLWEVSQADPQYEHYWSDLYSDPHFGPMAKSFLQAAIKSGFDPSDERAVQAGMKAAFQTWPTVGEPLRSEGYDDYLMAWLECQAAKWDAPVEAHARFTHEDMAAITSIGQDKPYWSPEEDPETLAALDRFEPRFDERFAAMDEQLKPAESGVVIDARAVKAWQAKRRPAPAATLPAPGL